MFECKTKNIQPNNIVVTDVSSAFESGHKYLHKNVMTLTLCLYWKGHVLLSLYTVLQKESSSSTDSLNWAFTVKLLSVAVAHWAAGDHETTGNGLQSPVTVQCRNSRSVCSDYSLMIAAFDFISLTLNINQTKKCKWNNATFKSYQGLSCYCSSFHFFYPICALVSYKLCKQFHSQYKGSGLRSSA